MLLYIHACAHTYEYIHDIIAPMQWINLRAYKYVVCIHDSAYSFSLYCSISWIPVVVCQSLLVVRRLHWLLMSQLLFWIRQFLYVGLKCGANEEQNNANLKQCLQWGYNWNFQHGIDGNFPYENFWGWFCYLRFEFSTTANFYIITPGWHVSFSCII
jgi:hypothetical protein